MGKPLDEMMTALSKRKTLIKVRDKVSSPPAIHRIDSPTEQTNKSFQFNSTADMFRLLSILSTVASFEHLSEPSPSPRELPRLLTDHFPYQAIPCSPSRLARPTLRMATPPRRQIQVPIAWALLLARVSAKMALMLCASTSHPSPPVPRPPRWPPTPTTSTLRNHLLPGTSTPPSITIRIIRRPVFRHRRAIRKAPRRQPIWAPRRLSWSSHSRSLPLSTHPPMVQLLLCTTSHLSTIPV